MSLPPQSPGRRCRSGAPSRRPPFVVWFRVWYRVWWRFCFCAPWLLCTPVWAGGAAPASIESLMGALSRVEGVEAAYTETVESALLATVLTGSGRLSYVAPERIVKTDAAGDGVEIDGERIRVRKGGAVEEFAVRDYLPLERLVAALRATFAGDLVRLRRDFTLDFATGPDGWTLVLRPRERALAAVFERMEIAGRGDLIARIDLTEAGGDRRTMALRTDLIRRRPAAP